jgi:hypothetical protein
MLQIGNWCSVFTFIQGSLNGRLYEHEMINVEYVFGHYSLKRPLYGAQYASVF